MALRERALAALCQTQPDAKIAAVQLLQQQAAAGLVGITQGALSCSTLHGTPLPGRPERPLLVAPSALPKRSINSLEGRAALIHAICHIEFNAINLALDAVWRFADMPDAYYIDWLQVAAEEALHFDLISQHLNSLGFRYGDFPAHNGLWEMVEKTQADVLARMALVPRILEARGLDANPAIQEKLQNVGDQAAVDILAIILRDEIGHVAIGNHWFHYLCEKRGLEPLACFNQLMQQYQAPKLQAPFNIPARRAAGFSETELAHLLQNTQQNRPPNLQQNA